MELVSIDQSDFFLFVLIFSHKEYSLRLLLEL